MKFLRKIPYLPLIIAAILLGLAPFKPEPHLVEKFRMLLAGSLTRPLDIFDLFYHSIPIILLIIKFVDEKKK
jgi:hypothetical protein